MTIFSKIIQREIPAYIISENDLFLAFLDIFPVKKGHTLVVPKVETDKLFELEDNYLSNILLFAKPVALALEKTFPSCNRVSIMTVGLEVPHAHLHLIPMTKTEDMNLAQSKLKLQKDELMKIQQDIIGNLHYLSQTLNR